MSEFPPVDTKRTGPEGTVRVTGHYWVDDRRWVEAVWTGGSTNIFHRELIDLDDFNTRFPQETP